MRGYVDSNAAQGEFSFKHLFSLYIYMDIYIYIYIYISDWICENDAKELHPYRPFSLYDFTKLLGRFQAMKTGKKERKESKRKDKRVKEGKKD